MSKGAMPITGTRQLTFRTVRKSENLYFAILTFIFFRKSEGGNYLIFGSPVPFVPIMLLVYFFWQEIALFRAKRYFITINGYIVGLFAISEKPGALFVEVLAVAPGFRKKGIAIFVLGIITAAAVKSGKELELSVFKSNIPAQHLYQKNGFRKKKDKKMSIILRKARVIPQEF